MHSFRKQADGIIAIGPCMRDRLVSQGLDADKITVAENWSDSSVIRVSNLPSGGPLRILYSGNLGLAHETETIGKVMLRLRDAKHVHFTFAGGGSRQREVKALCEQNNVRNVSFEPYVDRQGLGDRLARCHIGLVTLRPGCDGTLVPSKVYSLLAAGRPILYIGPEESTLARIAREGCGWHYDSGDAEGVISLIDEISSDREVLEAASYVARRAFAKKYDKPQGARRIVNVLLSAVENGQVKLVRIDPKAEVAKTPTACQSEVSGEAERICRSALNGASTHFL
jgi:glycosyltransferase involved in cell wall biosynthesis